MSYLNSTPVLKDISFRAGAIELKFEDGRKLISPLKDFPEIKKLSAVQRKKYHIIGGVGFDFDDGDEVYHIYDFIGNASSEFTSEKKSVMVSEAAAEYKPIEKKKK